MSIRLKVLAWLLSFVPNVVFEKLCQRNDGHEYSIVVMHLEDVYSLDPTTKCSLCGAGMSEETYNSIAELYASVLAEMDAA